MALTYFFIVFFGIAAVAAFAELIRTLSAAVRERREIKKSLRLRRCFYRHDDRRKG